MSGLYHKCHCFFKKKKKRGKALWMRLVAFKPGAEFARKGTKFCNVRADYQDTNIEAT